MKRKNPAVAILGAVLLLGAAAAAALYLTNRRDLTTSSDQAARVYREAVENERRFYMKEARLGFAKALELDPHFAEAMLGLGRLSEREQSLAMTRRAGKEAARLTERERLHVRLQLAMVDADRKEVLRIAQLIHEKFPDDIRAAQALAAHESEIGNTERAVEIFGELLSVEPNNADAYNQIGYHYGYRGDYEKAIQNLKKYQFMAPDQANPHDSLGEIQAYSGHYDEAIENLHRALAVKPDFYESYNHLGVAYEGKGEFGTAVESYLKAAELTGNAEQRVGYYAKAVRAAAEGEDRATAEAIAKRLAAATKTAETDVVEPAVLAVVDLLSGRPAQAERELLGLRPALEKHYEREKARGDKPYWPFWNLLLAKARLAQGRGDEAIALYREMANPPNPWRDFEGRRYVYEGRAALAELLAERGDLGTAEKLLDENRKWNPSWAPTRRAELAVARLAREKVLAASN